MIRQCAALAVAVLGSVSGLTAQTPAPDPWQTLPPLQTTCYGDNEFMTKLHDLHLEFGAQMQKQNEMNIAVETEFQKLGMQEVMRRMTELMRKDPQKAMAMMQAQQAAGASMTNAVLSVDEVMAERNAEFTRDSAAFFGGFEAAAKPLRARRDEIMRTSTRVVGGGGDTWEFSTKAAETEYNALIDKENAEYEARCVSYFGANGKVQSWLASYKKTVLDPVAAGTEALDATTAVQYAVLESPGRGYRSTAQLTAVREYLLVAQRAYGTRLHKIKNVH